MCQKCSNNSCTGGCSGSSSSEMAQITNQLAEVSNQLSDLTSATQAFLQGHPIMTIEDPDDISSFDMSSGLGSNVWDGWAVCNGASHMSVTAKKMITTPDLTNLFLVGAGDNYTVGDTGGSDTVVLIINELPSHNHTLTDPGHNHGIIDGGHTHGITQTPHTHVASGGTHNHTYSGTTTTDGQHSHTTGFFIIGSGGNDITVKAADANTGTSDAVNGNHNHTYSGTTSDAAVSVAVTAASISITNQTASTGVSVQNDFTGISIANTGSGTAHENRPPYYAVIYVKRIG